MVILNFFVVNTFFFFQSLAFCYIESYLMEGSGFYPMFW